MTARLISLAIFVAAAAVLLTVMAATVAMFPNVGCN